MSTPIKKSTARVFFALLPSEAERKQFAQWQKPLHHLCGGRAMRSETLHSTLVFVGEIEQSRLETLKLAAKEINVSTFDVCFDSAHYWRHNHIVYAAPGDVPKKLEQLVYTLEKCLEKNGVEFDRRAYKSHVTLLRNAQCAGMILPEMKSACWQIREFVLVQSIQHQGVADYLVLARFPLLPTDG